MLTETVRPDVQKVRCSLIRDTSEGARNAYVGRFTVYTGASMTPTLCELEVMQVVPYCNRPIKPGDVVSFLPPGRDQGIVHRVVRITNHGIRTLGDNNPQEDDWLLLPTDILGQVVAAWRGQTRRRIHGGRVGQFYSRWVRLLRVLRRAVAPLLRPVYRTLVQSRIVCRLVPGLRPRVVVFQVDGQNRRRLLFGRRIIGSYNAELGRWVIPRPFDLLVDEQALYRQQVDET